MRYARIDRVTPTDPDPSVDRVLRAHIGKSFEVLDCEKNGDVQIKISGRKTYLSPGEYTNIEVCPKCQAEMEWDGEEMPSCCPLCKFEFK